MKISLNDGELRLPPNRPIGLRGGRGARIVCTHGTIWITAEGKREDIFLLPGEDYIVPNAGLVLIEGMVESGIRIMLAGPDKSAVKAGQAPRSQATCWRASAA